MRVLGFVLILLAWMLAAQSVLADEHSSWQRLENNPGCVVWNPHPHEHETVTWSGACANSKAQGRGTVVWRNVEDGEWKESRYEGDYKDGKRTGRGLQVYADGGRYEGDWADDKRHGRGVLVLADGSRYEGDFRDGFPVHECDRLAADPEDLDKVTEGVNWDNLAPAAAIEACEDALRRFPKSDRFHHQLALALAKSERYDEALVVLDPLAQKGHWAAQALLGTMYLNGRGVPKSRKIAVDWFLKTPTLVLKAQDWSRFSDGSNDAEGEYNIQAYKWSYISAELTQKDIVVDWFLKMAAWLGLEGQFESLISDRKNDAVHAYEARGNMIWLGMKLTSTDISKAKQLAEEWLK